MAGNLYLRGSDLQAREGLLGTFARPRISAAAIGGTLILLVIISGTFALAASLPNGDKTWSAIPLTISIVVGGLGIGRIAILEHRRRVLVAEEFSELVNRIVPLRARGVNRFAIDYLGLQRAFYETDTEVSQRKMFSGLFKLVSPYEVEVQIEQWRNVRLLADWLRSHHEVEYAEQLLRISQELEHQPLHDYLHATALAKEFREQGEYERADVLDQLFAAPSLPEYLS